MLCIYGVVYLLIFVKLRICRGRDGCGLCVCVSAG